jgi:hypothetical protein
MGARIAFGRKSSYIAGLTLRQAQGEEHVKNPHAEPVEA